MSIAHPLGASTFWFFSGSRPMADHQFETMTFEPVHLKVDDLPSDVAEEIRDVQVQDPEFLRSVLLYGMTYRAVFETLSQAWRT